MNQTTLKVLKYTVVKNMFRYRLKIQLFSENKSHFCLPNVEVWEDMERGLKSFQGGLRFEGLGVETITLENTDMAILFYFPKTESYIVEGTRRKSGAIGINSHLRVYCQAEDAEQAEEMARHGSYIEGYENVHVELVELESEHKYSDK